MGLYDRDYIREPQRGRPGYGMEPAYGGPGGGGRRFSPLLPQKGSIVWWLVGINVAVFVLNLMTMQVNGRISSGLLFQLGMFNFDLAILHLQLWRFITFQFLHFSIGHILFNMIALVFFGPIMEKHWGSFRFVVFYLICGIGGALFYTFLALLGVFGSMDNVFAQMAGASAGIYGILIGSALVAPDIRVMLLIPPIPMKLRTMAWLLLGIAVVFTFMNWNNAGGEAAHLGGAIFGFILVKFPLLLSWAGGGVLDQWRAGFTERSRQREADRWQRMTEREDQLLEKIRNQGMQSLSGEERRFLEKMTEERRRRG